MTEERRRGVIRVTAEMLVELLESLIDGCLVKADGSVIKIKDMPRGAHVKGVRVDYWAESWIELLLEGSPDLPVTSEGSMAQRIEPYFTTVYQPKAEEKGHGHRSLDTKAP